MVWNIRVYCDSDSELWRVWDSWKTTGKFSVTPDGLEIENKARKRRPG